MYNLPNLQRNHPQLRQLNNWTEQNGGMLDGKMETSSSPMADSLTDVTGIEKEAPATPGMDWVMEIPSSSSNTQQGEPLIKLSSQLKTDVVSQTTFDLIQGYKDDIRRVDESLHHSKKQQSESLHEKLKERQLIKQAEMEERKQRDALHYTNVMKLHQRKQKNQSKHQRRDDVESDVMDDVLDDVSYDSIEELKGKANKTKASKKYDVRNRTENVRPDTGNDVSYDSIEDLKRNRQNEPIRYDIRNKAFGIRNDVGDDIRNDISYDSIEELRREANKPNDVSNKVNDESHNFLDDVHFDSIEKLTRTTKSGRAVKKDYDVMSDPRHDVGLNDVRYDSIEELRGKMSNTLTHSLDDISYDSIEGMNRKTNKKDNDRNKIKRKSQHNAELSENTKDKVDYDVIDDITHDVKDEQKKARRKSELIADENEKSKIKVDYNDIEDITHDVTEEKTKSKRTMDFNVEQRKEPKDMATHDGIDEIAYNVIDKPKNTKQKSKPGVNQRQETKEKLQNDVIKDIRSDVTDDKLVKAKRDSELNYDQRKEFVEDPQYDVIEEMAHDVEDDQRKDKRKTTVNIHQRKTSKNEANYDPIEEITNDVTDEQYRVKAISVIKKPKDKPDYDVINEITNEVTLESQKRQENKHMLDVIEVNTRDNTNHLRFDNEAQSQSKYSDAIEELENDNSDKSKQGRVKAKCDLTYEQRKESDKARTDVIDDVTSDTNHHCRSQIVESKNDVSCDIIHDVAEDSKNDITDEQMNTKKEKRKPDVNYDAVEEITDEVTGIKRTRRMKLEKCAKISLGDISKESGTDVTDSKKRGQTKTAKPDVFLESKKDLSNSEVIEEFPNKETDWQSQKHKGNIRSKSDFSSSKDLDRTTSHDEDSKNDAMDRQKNGRTYRSGKLTRNDVEGLTNDINDKDSMGEHDEQYGKTNKLMTDANSELGKDSTRATIFYFTEELANDVHFTKMDKKSKSDANPESSKGVVEKISKGSQKHVITKKAISDSTSKPKKESSRETSNDVIKHSKDDVEESKKYGRIKKAMSDDTSDLNREINNVVIKDSKDVSIDSKKHGKEESMSDVSSESREDLERESRNGITEEMSNDVISTKMDERNKQAKSDVIPKSRSKAAGDDVIEVLANDVTDSQKHGRNERSKSDVRYKSRKDFKREASTEDIEKLSNDVKDDHPNDVNRKVDQNEIMKSTEEAQLIVLPQTQNGADRKHQSQNKSNYDILKEVRYYMKKAKKDAINGLRKDATIHIKQLNRGKKISPESEVLGNDVTDSRKHGRTKTAQSDAILDSTKDFSNGLTGNISHGNDSERKSKNQDIQYDANGSKKAATNQVIVQSDATSKETHDVTCDKKRAVDDVNKDRERTLTEKVARPGSTYGFYGLNTTLLQTQQQQESYLASFALVGQRHDSIQWVKVDGKRKKSFKKFIKFLVLFLVIVLFGLMLIMMERNRHQNDKVKEVSLNKSISEEGEFGLSKQDGDTTTQQMTNGVGNKTFNDTVIEATIIHKINTEMTGASDTATKETQYSTGYKVATTDATSKATETTEVSLGYKDRAHATVGTTIATHKLTKDRTEYKAATTTFATFRATESTKPTVNSTATTEATKRIAGNTYVVNGQTTEKVGAMQATKAAQHGTTDATQTLSSESTLRTQITKIITSEHFAGIITTSSFIASSVTQSDVTQRQTLSHTTTVIRPTFTTYSLSTTATEPLRQSMSHTTATITPETTLGVTSASHTTLASSSVVWSPYDVEDTVMKAEAVCSETYTTTNAEKLLARIKRLIRRINNMLNHRFFYCHVIYRFRHRGLRLLDKVCGLIHYPGNGARVIMDLQTMAQQLMDLLEITYHC